MNKEKPNMCEIIYQCKCGGDADLCRYAERREGKKECRFYWWDWWDKQPNCASREASLPEIAKHLGCNLADVQQLTQNSGTQTAPQPRKNLHPDPPTPKQTSDLPQHHQKETS
jgi:hypothetical protein